MLMRRSLGISVAFLVISTGAMAAPPERAASHHSDQPCGDKSQRATKPTARTHVVSLKPSGTRARSVRHEAATRHRQAASHLAAHHDDEAAPPQPLGRREIGTAAWYNHVGSPTSSGERLDTVPGLADDLDAAHLAEEIPQLIARQLLVVDKDRSQAHAVTRSGAASSGISTLAHVPSPGMLVSFT